MVDTLLNEDREPPFTGRAVKTYALLVGGQNVWQCSRLSPSDIVGGKIGLENVPICLPLLRVEKKNSV